MADAIFMLTFIFFLGLCFYFGLAGRSFWLIFIITACVFLALNAADIFYPQVPDMPRANVIGLSGLIFLIYLVLVASSFLVGFATRKIFKLDFGRGTVNVIEWALILIVTVSVFGTNLYLRANANVPEIADSNTPTP